MCICINCEYVDRCTTYHAVEEQHQQAHLTPAPDFEATQPSINVNIRTLADGVEMEWDVVGCLSFDFYDLYELGDEGFIWLFY